MEVFLGGAWREPTTAEAYVNGAWRTLRYAEAYIDGDWRRVATFADPLTLALSASVAFGYENSSTVTTNNAIVATPSGGLGPYTYAWTKQSGDTISAVSPALGTTYFTATGMVLDESREAVFRCTCTDSLGSTATADVTVTLTRLDLGGA